MSNCTHVLFLCFSGRDAPAGGRTVGGDPGVNIPGTAARAHGILQDSFLLSFPYCIGEFCEYTRLRPSSERNET